MPEADTTDSLDRDVKWKHQPPYTTTENEKFEASWTGSCHCGKVQYQLSRDRPLASKYCHCRTCQRLHAAPFQWAAIFHKTDINFVAGRESLGWYDASSKSPTHHLPCKVYCAFCRAAIMDEGSNMILVFPSLIEGIETEAAREAFKAHCHLFYGSRLVDFQGDGLDKWSGLNGESSLLNDEGHAV